MGDMKRKRKRKQGIFGRGFVFICACCVCCFAALLTRRRSTTRDRGTDITSVDGRVRDKKKGR